jgi:hypothetical protein
MDCVGSGGGCGASRRNVVNDSQIELSIGETFYIGGYAVTVLDIDGDEIRFRIESPEDDDSGASPSVLDRMYRPR